jgi:hypothetical protein
MFRSPQLRGQVAELQAFGKAMRRRDFSLRQ